ncbi:MAG: DUF2905 domain-containing protein [Aggregatilineales bacterium]
MDLQNLGRLLLILGIAIAIVGALLLVLGRSGLFGSFGNLPGDIRIEGQGFTCLIPIVSMLLISVILTIVVNIIIRLINRP